MSVFTSSTFQAPQTLAPTPQSTISDAAIPPLASGDRVVIDLDGTLVRGGVAIDGAAELLECLANRFVIVSNNSRDLSGQVAARLSRLGLYVPTARLVLAGEQTIRFVAEKYPRARCLIAASNSLRLFARSLGLEPVHERPSFVILGRDTQFDYQRLALLANMLRGGARLIVVNPDLTHPDLDGRVVPETGALLAALMGAAGVRPCHVIGKPEPLLFELALERLGSDARDTIVVGDNPGTDALGAERAGLRHLLVDPAGGERPSLRALLSAWSS